MKREHYLPKKPKYGNKQCETFSHIDINGEKVMKNKQNMILIRKQLKKQEN